MPGTPGGINYGTQYFGRIAYTTDSTFLVNTGFVSHAVSAVSSDPWLVIDSVVVNKIYFKVPFDWLGVGPRVAFIYITDLVDGSGTGYLQIVQTGCANYALDRYSESVPYSGITADPLTVVMNQGVDNHQAPASWTAAIDVSWITVTPASGNYAAGAGPAGSPHLQLIHFDVALNPTTSARVGHITIHGAFNCGPDPVFTVNQDAGPGGGGGGAPFDGSGYSNPFCLPERDGYYLRAGIATTGIGGVGNAVCLRSHKSAPFGKFDDVGVITTAGSATDPRIAYIPDVRRLLAVYRYSGDTYIAYSDDDGHSWAGRTLHIAGGKHPTIATAEDHTIVTAAYIAPVGMATYGTLQAKVRGPGDTAFGAIYTLKDASGSPLQPQDDSFHLLSRHEGERTWLLIGLFGTDTGPSVWQSADPDASTWTRLASVLPGGKHPTISEGQDRTLLAAAYIAPTGGATYGTIQISLRGPGETAFGTPYTLKDPAGANILVLDDSFHLCQPPVGPRWWVWTLMIGTDTGCSEWYSAEPDSKSVTRVV